MLRRCSRSRWVRIVRRICIRARERCSRSAVGCDGSGARSSRAPLREAIELFDVLGATQWSDRARQELRASGETLGPRRPDARHQLTAQELQIAGLAARGLSNREIGERLFLSHRTIGSHLYRIFPKLGITSRTQLRDALPAAADS
jgi:DNA-binding NarL/FixJ family response regulator